MEKSRVGVGSGVSRISFCLLKLGWSKKIGILCQGKVLVLPCDASLAGDSGLILRVLVGQFDIVGGTSDLG